jgi:hypothetical protein
MYCSVTIFPLYNKMHLAKKMRGAVFSHTTNKELNPSSSSSERIYNVNEMAELLLPPTVS